MQLLPLSTTNNTLVADHYTSVAVSRSILAVTPRSYSRITSFTKTSPSSNIEPNILLGLADLAFVSPSLTGNAIRLEPERWHWLETVCTTNLKLVYHKEVL